MAWLAQIDAWYATQSSAAIQALDQTTDFDGNTLLDNTVVVYLSEIGRAYDHDQKNVPFLVFGGKNTRIKGGQYLKITDGPLTGLENVTGNRPGTTCGWRWPRSSGSTCRHWATRCSRPGRYRAW